MLHSTHLETKKPACCSFQSICQLEEQTGLISAAFSFRSLTFKPPHFWFLPSILTLRFSFFQTTSGRLQDKKPSQFIREASPGTVSLGAEALLRGVSSAGNSMGRWKSTEICFAWQSSYELNVYNFGRELTGFGVFHGEKKPEINKK